MRIKRTKVYKFPELDARAKERARDWFREGGLDYEWWDSTYEDAVTIAGLFGLTIRSYSEKYHVEGRDGKPGRDGQQIRSAIFFSGFCSQGDGACFEGDYEFKADAVAAVEGYAEKDETLHRIVRRLQDAQASAGNKLAFRINHEYKQYSHSGCMGYELTTPEEDAESITREQEKAATDALRAFADWIYRRLEKEYEYLTSDESVDETIRCNGYEFTADGRRA